MTDYLVTVVIPCYNAGEYVEEAIRSVQRQSIAEKVEIIVVNDGSNDKKTLDVLKTIEANGIQLVHQKNLGLSEARNSGIRKAKGQYICCLDSDDRIEKSYLEKAVGIFEKNKDNNLGIVTSWIQCFGSSDELWKPINYDPIALLTTNVLSVASVYKKEIWSKAGGYKRAMNGSSVEGKLGGYEDWEFWISIVERGYTWCVIEEALLNYRRTPNSMINTSSTKHNELYSRIIQLHGDYFSKNHKKVIERLMEKVNYLEQIVIQKEKNELKLFGVGSSVINRIKENPKKLLELNNYKKLGKRIIRKK